MSRLMGQQAPRAVPQSAAAPRGAAAKIPWSQVPKALSAQKARGAQADADRHRRNQDFSREMGLEPCASYGNSGGQLWGLRDVNRTRDIIAASAAATAASAAVRSSTAVAAVAVSSPTVATATADSATAAIAPEAASAGSAASPSDDAPGSTTTTSSSSSSSSSSNSSSAPAIRAQQANTIIAGKSGRDKRRASRAAKNLLSEIKRAARQARGGGACGDVSPGPLDAALQGPVVEACAAADTPSTDASVLRELRELQALLDAAEARARRQQNAIAAARAAADERRDARVAAEAEAVAAHRRANAAEHTLAHTKATHAKQLGAAQAQGAALEREPAALRSTLLLAVDRRRAKGGERLPQAPSSAEAKAAAKLLSSFQRKAQREARRRAAAAAALLTAALAPAPAAGGPVPPVEPISGDGAAPPPLRRDDSAREHHQPAGGAEGPCSGGSGAKISDSKSPQPGGSFLGNIGGGDSGKTGVLSRLPFHVDIMCYQAAGARGDDEGGAAPCPWAASTELRRPLQAAGAAEKEQARGRKPGRPALLRGLRGIGGCVAQACVGGLQALGRVKPAAA
ncbi:MAG: hypothetical protein J3K34DRAFT_487672 [Monoraphidium minutum]|nr:MAG: hypothetical protein J3K34DRAFT_487672 [Monoraphidium minutum]